MLGRLLTAREVAETLALTPETVLAWQRDGKLPAIKLPSGQIRFKQEELEAWLGERSTRVIGQPLTIVRGERQHA